MQCLEKSSKQGQTTARKDNEMYKLYSNLASLNLKQEAFDEAQRKKASWVHKLFSRQKDKPLRKLRCIVNIFLVIIHDTYLNQTKD